MYSWLESIICYPYIINSICYNEPYSLLYFLHPSNQTAVLRASTNLITYCNFFPREKKMSVLGMAKEAVERALIFGKFLCFLHITDSYICSPIIVCFISSPYCNFFIFHWIPSLKLFIRWCFQVHGPSMLPTMNLTGDVVLAEHISPRLGHLGTGDIVLVRSPENPRKTVTKRILGMEGDKVTFLVDPNYDSGNYRTIVVCSIFFFFD